MYCKRYKATITTAVCLNRQKVNKQNHVSMNGKKKLTNHPKYSGCVDCEQGKKLNKTKGIDRDMDVEQLKEIHQKEKRPLSSPAAAKLPQQKIRENVITYPLSDFCSPEEIEAERAERAKKADLLIDSVVTENAAPAFKPCPRHPDRPQVIGRNGNSTGLCRDCLAQRAKNSHMIRQANKNADIVPDSKRYKLSNSQTIVDFKEYPNLFEWLENNAKRNLRTLNNEIIYQLLTATDIEI